MIKIFINFRKDDSGPAAHKINQHLEEIFGDENVFYYPQDPVEDINEVLDHLRSSDVMLVLIGSKWLEELESRQARSGEPDWVFDEIRNGLTTDGVLVIPVLIDDAIHPPVTMLPDAIKSLHYKRNENVHTDDRFEEDMKVLVARIKKRNARFGGISKFYPSLPNDLLREKVAKARRIIRIMTIWTARWELIAESLDTALHNGARLEILLLDPTNSVAAQRDKDLGKPTGYTAGRIRDNVLTLRDFAQSHPDVADRITLKLFNAIPSRVLYLVDETILIGTHSIGKLSADAPHILAFGEETPLYQNLNQHFLDLWNAPHPYTQVISLQSPEIFR